ncbi:hypothetical protein PINS_up021774 [Pythium insidiosum]|nr:hypothetical protein PINS_up021774 [Pythium insidiosum]
MPPRSLYAALAAGALLRGALHASPAITSTLASRPELVTALSSWRRVRESVYLFNSIGSPYAGDVFHQPPLVFAAFYPVLSLPVELQATVAALFLYRG